MDEKRLERIEDNTAASNRSITRLLTIVEESLMPRLDDHEARLRRLERFWWGMVAVLTVASIVLSLSGGV